MSSSLTPVHADLITERLALRSWTAADVAAVLDGSRPADRADDSLSIAYRATGPLFRSWPAARPLTGGWAIEEA